MSKRPPCGHLDRRTLLAISGTGLAALAGCSESSDASDGEDGSDGEDSGDGGSSDDSSSESDGADGSDGESEDQGQGTASFDVTGVEHPDEVATGEEHDLVVTVENTGDAAGDYEELLEFSVGGTNQWESVGNVVIEDVASGESGTWEVADVAFDNPGTVQYRLEDTEWEYDVTITEPDPQSFSGSGQTVEQGIDIEGGLVVVEGEHDGERNFQMSLANDSEFDDSFINVIGEFDGAQAALIEGGEYILDVNADGNWEVTIRQPRSGQGEELPTSFAGNGPDVVGPVQFGGTNVAIGEHDGERNFQVEIYPMTGSFGELVFNEIGEFEGETTFSFSGVGWIDINASGNWGIELE